MTKILKRNVKRMTLTVGICIVILMLLLLPTPSTQAASNVKDDSNISLKIQSNTTTGLLRTEDRSFSPYFSYIHVAGAALKPRASNTEWSTDSSGGCLYVSGGSASTVYNIHLEIPDGARIDYLRIFYNDASTSDSYAWVTRYDDYGGIEDVASVTSSGSSGYGTQLSSFVSHEVDNVNYSYVLNWRPVVVGSSMQLCGLRVAYRVLMTESYLPLILK